MLSNLKNYFVSRRAILIGIATIQLILVILYLQGAIGETPLGVPLDDSWIYYDFARNFSTHGQYAFNEGEWSSGVTSLLWTFLIALGMRTGISGVVSSLVLGLVLHGISAIAIYEISTRCFRSLISPQQKEKKRLKKKFTNEHRQLRNRQFVSSKKLGFLSAVLFLICGNLIWHSLSGMETSMFLAFGLLLILAYTSRQFLLVNLFSGLLILTRVEGLCLIGLCGLIELIRQIRTKDKKAWRPLFSMFICTFSVAGFYFLYNYALTKHCFPTTFASRRWLFMGLGSMKWTHFQLIKEYVRQWLLFLRLSIFAGFSCQHSPGRIGVLTTCYLGFLFLSLSVGFGRCIKLILLYLRRRSESEAIVLLFLWFILHNVAYAICLPSPGHAGRYQAINSVMVWLLLPIGMISLLQIYLSFRRESTKKAPPNPLSVSLFFSAFILFLLVVDLSSTVAWRKVYASSTYHINHVHVQSGKWMDENLPQDAKVAAFDIGAIKYYSNRKVIDIGGLIDPGFKPYRDEGRVVDYLRQNGATHLAMPEMYDGSSILRTVLGLCRRGENRFQLRKLKHFQISVDKFARHAMTTRNASPRIAIYEIDWKY